MRRTVLMVVTAVTLTFMGAAAWAGIADHGPGCGLGKELWKDSKETQTVGSHLLISTTNNPLIPLQAGGITTGTWGCENNRKVWTENRTNAFAKLNFEDLSQDMAQGGGEHLASLARLMGVPEEKQAEFFALSQARYQALIEAGEPTPRALLAALHEVLEGHPLLAQAEPSR